MTARPNLPLRMAPLRHLVVLALLASPATAEVEEDGWFVVNKGLLSANVKKLVEHHGWTLEWTSAEDRRISQPFKMESESLTHGLNTLLNLYEGRLVADLYSGNKVVHVFPKPHNMEVMLPPDDYIGDIQPVRLKVVELKPAPKDDTDVAPPPPPQEAPQPPPAQPPTPPSWTEVKPEEEEEEEVDYTGSEVYDVEPIDKSGIEPHSQLLPDPPVTIEGSLPAAVFQVQVAALKEKEKAEAMVEHLLKLGYDARVSEYWRNDQPWFRVRVHVDANENTDKVRKDLEAHGYPVWVLLEGFSAHD